MSQLTIPKVLMLIGVILVVVFVLASLKQDIDSSFFVALLYNDANEFAEVGAITSNFMPIGYSGFLGLCIAHGGINLIPVCQSLIYVFILLCALLLLTFRGVTGHKLFFGILITAIHPVLFLNIWRVHDGNITVLLLLGLLVACLYVERERNFLGILVLGVISGLLFVVRMNTILLVLPVLLIVYFPKIFQYGVLIFNKNNRIKNKESESISRNYFNQSLLFLFISLFVFVIINTAVKQKPFYFPMLVHKLFPS